MVRTLRSSDSHPNQAEQRQVTSSNAGPDSRSRRTSLLLGLGLVALTLVTFRAVPEHDFVNFDDGLYVTENPRTQAGLEPENLVWALTSLEPSNWHPLTLWSHMLDCELYGLDPRGHHLTSLLLHAACVLALFHLLATSTSRPWPSALAAALFAIHPQHVESVAWVAERKDVLSTLFWFLTMIGYVAFVRQRTVWRYMVVVGLFALGLMAKSMLVTLPVVLVLFDYWPLGRLDWGFSTPHRKALLASIVEKTPLYLMSAAVCVVTIVAQTGAISSREVVPLGLRLANAADSYLTYLVKTVVPTDLGAFYPLQQEPAIWRALAGVGLLLAATIVVLLRRRIAGYWTTGWLWYLVTLLPVIGIVQVGAQARADRYTYVPLVGIFIGIAWSLDALVGKRRAWRAAVATLAVSWVVALAFVASRQVSYWADSVTLFERAIAVTNDNRVAELNLAEAYSDRGDPAALDHYRKAIEIDAEWPQAWAGLGETLRQWSRIPEALPALARAVELAPEDPRLRFSLARTLAAANRPSESIEQLRRALEIDPSFAAAHQGLGVLYEEEGEPEAALSHYRTALELDSSRVELEGRIERLGRRQGEEGGSPRRD